MAADPGLDRIAAGFEDSLLLASPSSRAAFDRITGRFLANQLAVFDGDPAELGAVFLNLYRELATLADPRSAGIPAAPLGAEAILGGLQFYLAHGGVQLYLRRHPAAYRR